MKRSLLLCVLILSVFLVNAQDDRATISFRLMDAKINLPLSDVQVLIPQHQQIFSADTSGVFVIKELPMGRMSLLVLQNNETIDSFEVQINQAEINLGDIPITGYVSNQLILQDLRNIPSIALEADPNVLDDEAIGEQQNISIVLNSAGSRDPFLNAASFVFGQYNFRPRGYNRNAQQVLINGVLMNDLHSGNAVWAQWGGLNEVTKNQGTTYGLTSHQQSYGAVNGVVAIDMSALEKSKQTKFSYAQSNRNYNQRLMLSHSTGISKSGWAVSLSASRRWASEAYISGTSFDAYSGFVSIAKIINDKQQVSLQFIAAQSSRSRSASATQELYSLSNNTFYNPNWGWQGDVKRNAKIATVFQPIAILEHKLNPNKQLNISTSLAFQTGQNAATSLDWYNAIDPRPDYYRNLPSNYQTTNAAIAQMINNTLVTNPDKLQIDWNRLYDANKANSETLYNINGNPNDSLSGKRSMYAIGADVEQIKKLVLGTNIVWKQNRKLVWSGGLQMIHQRSDFYRRMEDLLGGDYFLNYNMFAAQQFLGNQQYYQNDLNSPNRAILKGDKYRYHYASTINKAWVWLQLEANLKKITFFATVNSGMTSYLRDGQYRNGLFAQHSFGKSVSQSFINYTSKSGFTYKINGRNYLLINALYSKEDPGFNNIFIAPRTRNQTIENVQLQTTQSVEAGYLLRASRLNIRAMGYATEIKNATLINRFFNDDPEYQSFVNFVMSKVNTRYIGTELAIAYDINSMLSISGVVSIGQAFYTNRPQVQVYNDNDTNIYPNTKDVFIKNYYLGVGPQSAYTIGASYSGKRYWYLKMNANYFDRNYVTINPARRSVEAAEFMEPSNPLFSKIFNQEKLPSFFTLDLSGGKSWRMNKFSKKLSYSTMLYFNFGISNLLDNRTIISSGFEQLRYDFTNNNPDKFPNKYVYGFGRTFFANLSLKF
jgi:hypothetical protein